MFNDHGVDHFVVTLIASIVILLLIYNIGLPIATYGWLSPVLPTVTYMLREYWQNTRKVDRRKWDHRGFKAPILAAGVFTLGFAGFVIVF